MKRAGLYILVVLTTLVLGLVAKLPATTIWQAVEPRQTAGVAMRGVTGTLWRGEVAVLEMSGVTLEQVAWKVRPIALLRGRLQATWSTRFGEGHVTGAASISPSGDLHLYRSTGQIAASDLQRFFSLPVGPQGRISLDLEQIELQLAPLYVHSARGEVHWQGAGLVTPYAVNWGDLVARLGAHEGALRLELGDQGGPLRLQGQAAVLPQGVLQLDLAAAAAPGADEALRAGLAMLGRPDAQGWVRLRF